MLQDLQKNTVVNEQGRQVVVVPHNMRRFDGAFIQDALYKQGCSLEKILNQGAKMSFECGNLVFKDSLNFFKMPLEKLPATFNLRELHKGYFPYTYIRPEYYSYGGLYPPADTYKPDLMSEKKRKAFLTWHADKVETGAVFDYQKQLSAYLKSDVQVLKEACLAFLREMEDLTGVNPLTSCVTITSTAFRVFQKMFLKPDLIALEPRNGWRKHQVNQSQEPIEWLEFEDSKVGGMGRIQHVRFSRDGEVKVLTPAQAYFVDGFDQETRTVYEFHGCWYHGCKWCFKKKERCHEKLSPRSNRRGSL